MTSTSTRQRRLSKLGRFRIKTFDLYVARQYIVAYAICSVSFVGLFVIIESFAKLDRFLRQDTPFLIALVKYQLAMIPTAYAGYLSPVLTLAAAMFTMTSLTRHNELAPLKGAGISVYRIMAPLFVLATFLMVGTFLIKDRLIPRFKDPIREALSLSRARPLSPPPYFDGERGFLIRVHQYSPTKKIGHEVGISEMHPNGKMKQQVDANQMEWVASSDPEEGYWLLHDGSIQRWDEDGNLLVNAAASRFDRLKMPFRRMELQTNMRPIDLESSDVEISYLSWKDLKRQYRRQPYHQHLAVKLHHHFAFPLSHIVLLFLGLPFVLNLGTRSGFLSLAMSILICGVFFLVSWFSMSIANQSQILSPILATWLPVMLFASVGITMFDHLPT